MVSIAKALEAKSDQLNAIDLIAANKIIKIIRVDYFENDAQPVWVHFDNSGKPWKPSKGMRRALSFAWSDDTDAWIGKTVEITYEPSVIYAGKEVGGIEIAGMSDIPAKGLNIMIPISRTKKKNLKVRYVNYYPDDKFNAALPSMLKMISDGTMTLDKVIQQCEKTGQLTQEQSRRLKNGNNPPNQDRQNKIRPSENIPSDQACIG